MKKRFLFCLSLAGFMSASLSVALVNTSKDVKKVEGYSASSLPTTIDLNDTSAANIRSYYSSLNNLSTSERQGTNLLKNLKTILKNGQKYYSYENGESIWKMYEITDRDWEKSPASAISGYDSNTNKITGYSYNTSDPYVRALYINRDVDNQTKAWANHNQDQWGINREHIWPKAEGFDTKGAGGARGDPRHLVAANGYANNIHSNYYFGYVKTSSSYTDCGSKYSNQSGNLRGTSKTANTGTVFEPQDCDKGDIARAVFYMVARYNFLSGSDTDGIGTNNPNLTLTQNLSDWADSGYTSSTSNPGKLGILTDLLAWHKADPVDEYEIHRNNLLYTNFTKNRNPFVDFPEWVDYIWGTVIYNGSTYVSHSDTPTGYATPNSDTINGYNSGGTTVSVTGVSLNKNSTSITVNGVETLGATVSPYNATNQGVSWSSSNTSIATVSNGTVRGVAEGSATITVTTSDGGFTATCSVTVTASGGGGGGGSDPVDDVMVAKGFGGNAGSSYSAAGTDYTGVANLTDSSGSTYAMQVFIGSSGQVRGNKSGSGNFSLRNTTTYSGYYVSQVTMTIDSGGTLDGSDSSRSVVWFGSSAYANPTTAPSSGTKVSASPASSGQSTLTWTNSNTDYNYFILYNLKAVDSPKCKDADTPIVVTWSPIQSATKSLDSITLDTSDAPTTFNVGDTFSYDGLYVTANYDDGTSDFVTPSSVSTPSMSTAGQKTVTVSYTEGGVTKTATYTITVNANPSISWTAPTINVYSGSTLSGSDVNAWAVTYNDGAGHQTVLTYSQLTVKLGDTTISIPHTWSASDDGKTLTATYNSLTTSASSGVQVTQSVNTITASITTNYDYTFSAQQYTEAGTVNLGGHNWTMAGTGDGYWGYDSQYGKGQQFGSGSKPYSALTLTCSDFIGIVSSVTVYTSGASSVDATVQVSVGGTAYGSAQSISTSNTGYTFDLGGKSGNVVISWTQTSSKALYVKEIIVHASGTSTISNSVSHIAAQRVAVKFAKAFNAAMDTTNGCTTNLSSAWSTCSSAYNTFKTEAAALGSTEEAYARNLIKYATAQYSNDSGEACIERMMKTYEVCVNKHGQTAFMSELVTLSRIPINPLQISVKNSSTTIIIIVIASISVITIGGYFYFRRKKD